MTKRSVLAVIVLTLVTVGLYQVWWCVRTKHDLVEQGARIPTSWLLVIPILNIYWLWRWSEAVEQVTGGEVSEVTAFLLMLLLGGIGMWVVGVGFSGFGFLGPAILQHSFNQLEYAPVKLPAARVVV